MPILRERVTASRGEKKYTWSLPAGTWIRDLLVTIIDRRNSSHVLLSFPSNNSCPRGKGALCLFLSRTEIRPRPQRMHPRQGEAVLPERCGAAQSRTLRCIACLVGWLERTSFSRGSLPGADGRIIPSTQLASTWVQGGYSVVRTQ